MSIKRWGLCCFVAAALIAGNAAADERMFTYSYEASVLAEGEAEFEQWITNQNGKEDGDYSEWNFRSEIEYGVTDRFQTSLYLNWDSIRSEGVTGVEDEHGADFKSVSVESVYQLMNPNTDAFGLAGYLEFSTDGIDYELEPKILISKNIDSWILAANAIYEAEWEKEDGITEREASLIFTMGASYRLNPRWALGLEVRNKSAYPDGLNISGQEYNTWAVGPNLHYGNPKWWATLTVLPQVGGNGDGSQGSRQLVHEEALETRLIFGINL